MERRILTLVDVQTRAAGEAGPSLISGYSAVFHELSVVLFGMFREQIAPGAFTETVAQDDIRSLWNHNADLVLGRNRNGTLRLREDTKGLWMEVEPPDTQAGRDALTLIARGDVNQQSFMFDVLGDDWSEGEDGMVIRTLQKVKLYEVSPVTFPAYPQTSAEARGTDKLDVPPALPRWVEGRINQAGKSEDVTWKRSLRMRQLKLLGAR